MTGEDGKRGGGTGDVTTGANMNTNVTDNVNNVNANVNANINVSQQNGGPEKAPVVGGTNVETLPRAGKQVRLMNVLLTDTTDSDVDPVD
ncbi:hypothetical protein ALC60_13641 [Trachymyrmex zeteki]|uniref:Uncharacterized protein n=1 Tax=Mycetomoellerius zeteki TaxID=64791 RepID=A0A151WHM0_9HYME|nr:hypothetical protein ALC60_13641 [Trachymyrmex zeteki]